MVNDMKKAKKIVVAVIAMVVLVAGTAYALYWNAYWDDVKSFGQAIVWQDGRYEVTGFVDNQRRVHNHHGVDDPIAVTDDGNGWRYLVYADGSCEKLEF